VAKWPSKKSWSPKGKKSAVLAASKSKKSVFLIPWRQVKIAKLKAPSKIYELWSGYQSDQAFSINIPKTAEDLGRHGRVLRIDYTSDKWETPGDKSGRFHLYRHVYKRPPALFADKRKTTFGIKAPKGRNLVSPRGLIG
jgi:hypothetical protein